MCNPTLAAFLIPRPFASKHKYPVEAVQLAFIAIILFSTINWCCFNPSEANFYFRNFYQRSLSLAVFDWTIIPQATSIQFCSQRLLMASGLKSQQFHPSNTTSNRSIFDFLPLFHFLDGYIEWTQSLCLPENLSKSNLGLFSTVGRSMLDATTEVKFES